MTSKYFHCYMYGHPGAWEAICVDLDIAVNGASSEEVKSLMESAIATYIEDAKAESPEVAEQLLNRTSPWHVRARLLFGLLWYRIWSWFDGRSDNRTSGFDIHCPA